MVAQSIFIFFLLFFFHSAHGPLLWSVGFVALIGIIVARSLRLLEAIDR